jgi:two-component system, LytTR family, sensor kinase
MAVQLEPTPLTRLPPDEGHLVSFGNAASGASGAESLLGTQTHALVFASGRQISSATLFSLLHWGGWLLFGAVPFAWTVSSWGLLGALLNNGVFIASGGLLTLGLRRVYRRVRVSNVSYAILAPLVLLTCAVLGEVWYLCELLTARTAFQHLAAMEGLRAQFAFGAQQLAPAPLLMNMGLWFVYAFALLTWSSLYFGINSAMALELEKARVTFALKLADTARLKVLQTQLNPHFLFNALNGVATLIREHRGAAAAKMVSTLSDFLRATLHTANVPELTVSQELVFVDQYVELQQLRFTDRLRVSIEADEETYSALLPTLILQPLVENAVQHGVLPRERGGSVCVSITRRGADLRVAVEDDGPGPSKTGAPTFGVGLGNTTERLRALYGDDAALTIGRSASGGFSVVVRLPFRLSEAIGTSKGD